MHKEEDALNHTDQLKIKTIARILCLPLHLKTFHSTHRRTNTSLLLFRMDIYYFDSCFYKLFREIIKNFIATCSNRLSYRVHLFSYGSISGLLKKKFMKRYKMKILGLESMLRYSKMRKGLINNEIFHGVENK